MRQVRSEGDLKGRSSIGFASGVGKSTASFSDFQHGENNRGLVV